MEGGNFKGKQYGGGGGGPGCGPLGLPATRGNFPGGRCGPRGGAGGGRRESEAEGGGGSHFKGSFLPIMLCGDVDKWIQDGVESNDR